MRMSLNEKVGLTTPGLAGNVLLVAAIWGQISMWWLILAIFLLLSATGFEIGKQKNN